VKAPKSGHQLVLLAPGMTPSEWPAPTNAGRVSPPILAKAVLRSNQGPVLTSHPLAVVNASGKKGASEPVRLRLKSLGWTAPLGASREEPTQRYSTIHYAQVNLIAAQALAHTLPFPVRLLACPGECGGLRLVVGSDYLGWKPARQALAVWRDGRDVEIF
jgi:hypothetical protein